jgi:hypothetical protein
LRRGAPPSLRGKLWRAAFGLPVSPDSINVPLNCVHVQSERGNNNNNNGNYNNSNGTTVTDNVSSVISANYSNTNNNNNNNARQAVTQFICSDNEHAAFAQLRKQCDRLDLLTDRMMINDVETVTDDTKFFVFDVSQNFLHSLTHSLTLYLIHLLL